ncbi:MAG: OmpH family outer membrane protein [Deltaproteobacteria bacterium]|nr:OmpH family outer membrane protein [Deltaproteobacteria bacterium]
MRKTLGSILMAGLLCSPALTWAEDLKIGYVDLQKALNESESGKKAKDKFKLEVDRMEQSLEKRKQEVEKLKDELEKKGLLLKDEERGSLESDYRQKLRDFERQYKDSQQELQIKDREMTGRILEELRQVIQSMGEQGSYTVILEGNNTVVLYGSRAIDLTDTVIKSYDAKGPTASAK